MQLTHSFRVPVPVDEAWAVLRDVERIAPCMPGTTIESVDGEEFSGRVKVKVGPITVTYRGNASFVDVDDEHHRASIEASGKETKGAGTARATVRAELQPDGDETEVTVHTDLAVTGRPAQFGRGVMADVGGKLIGQFADCLSAELGAAAAPTAPDETVPETAAAADTAGPGPVPVTGEATRPPAGPVTPPRRQMTSASGDDDAIDLLGVAGAPMLKLALPAVAGAVLLLVWVLAARRRSRRSRSGPSA